MTPESVHRANGLEQCLLHEVLRFGLVPAEQASGTEQAVPVRGHQFLHGPRVLTAEPLDQLFLVHAPFVPPDEKGFKESTRNSYRQEFTGFINGSRKYDNRPASRLNCCQRTSIIHPCCEVACGCQAAHISALGTPLRGK